MKVSLIFFYFKEKLESRPPWRVVVVTAVGKTHRGVKRFTPGKVSGFPFFVEGFESEGGNSV